LLVLELQKGNSSTATSVRKALDMLKEQYNYGKR